MTPRRSARGAKATASKGKIAAAKMAANKSAQSNARGKGTWEKAFIAALSHNGVVTSACIEAGVGRTTVYDRRREDPAFALLWDEAIDIAADRIEAEVIRRAVDGYSVPVYYKGEVVGINREYSDTLAQMVLKAHKPEKYRERLQIDIVDINKALPILQELNEFLKAHNQDFTEAQRQFLEMLRAQEEASRNA